MKHTIETLLSALKSILLTESERVSMRTHITEQIKKTPAFSSGERFLSMESDKPVLSPFYNLLAGLKQNSLAPIAVGLIIALTVGSGAAFAAEGSLPGDTLYPIKVHVNETVQSSLAFSDEARAGVDAHLLERRLEEVARLSAEGRLNASARADLESRFERHLKSAEAHVAKIKSRGRSNSVAVIEGKIESSLGSYRDVLQALDEQSGNEDGEVRGILHAISVRATEATERRIKAVADGTLGAPRTLPQITAQHDAAVNAIVRAEATHKAVASKLSTERNQRITSELSLAQNAIVRGNKEVAENAHAQAFASYREALRLSVFVESMIRASGHVESSQRKERDNKRQDVSGDSVDKRVVPAGKPQREYREGVRGAREVDVRIDRGEERSR